LVLRNLDFFDIIVMDFLTKAARQIMCRAFTSDELRADFLGCLREYVQQWASFDDHTIEERLSGLAFSMLCMLDGVSAELPGFDVIGVPHEEDDKECLQETGDNWVEPDTALHSSDKGCVMLHEEWEHYREW